MEEQIWISGNRKEGSAVSSARNCFLPSNSLHCSITAISCSTVLLEKPTIPQTGKNLPTFLEPNVHYHIHNSLKLSQSSPFFLIKFNIIFPSTPKSPKWSLSLSCPHQNPPSTPAIHTCYMPRLPNYFSFVYPINICCTTCSHMSTAVPADEPCYVTHCYHYSP